MTTKPAAKTKQSEAHLTLVATPRRTTDRRTCGIGAGATLHIGTARSLEGRGSRSNGRFANVCGGDRRRPPGDHRLVKRRLGDSDK